ncbi:MAG: hypothetical protein JNM93_03165 [Bacteriovoracaceae bacterium]|nr:hypothetical protein [Bacteriovoracaceae bacterium]
MKHLLICLTFVLLAHEVQAGLPIEWSGVFAVDTMRINKYHGAEGVSPTYDPDSVALDGVSENAKFQSFIFRLEPKIIVNDAATIKGEFSMGPNRGGQLGNNDTTTAQLATNGFTHFTRPATSGSLVANKIYAELYADTAIYRIGRHTKSWGLGLLFDDGQDVWDRYLTVYDGIQIDYRIGNFVFTPQWAKINTENLTSQTDVKETGVSLLYDNKNSNTMGGIYYGSRKAGGANSYYMRLAPGGTDPATDLNSIGATSLTIIDLYAKKNWEKFSIGAEAISYTGDVQDPYGTGAPTNSSYKASAYIVETSYKLTPTWKLGLNAGHLSGASGDDVGEFGAMYANPNYQVAYLMFRYNKMAIEDLNDANSDVFASSITNANFLKFYADYNAENWTWKMAMIYATAVETAKAGSTYFNHVKGQLSSAAAGVDQKNDLGYEFDFGFDYRWNPSITLGGILGYHMTGDYYGFTGAGNLATTNSYIVGLNLGLVF